MLLHITQEEHIKFNAEGKPMPSSKEKINNLIVKFNGKIIGRVIAIKNIPMSMGNIEMLIDINEEAFNEIILQGK